MPAWLRMGAPFRGDGLAVSVVMERRSRIDGITARSCCLKALVKLFVALYESLLEKCWCSARLAIWEDNVIHRLLPRVYGIGRTIPDLLILSRCALEE